MNMMENNHRRPAVRVDTQDGPWSVSVAETPHDARSYSLYIKTPTHNMTLTRTAVEIVELDQKLHETNPTVKIPPLPINSNSVSPPKRKSNFLNTLSRLASPTSNRTSRRSTNPTAFLPTPIASPTNEINDPFTSFSATNVNSPSIAAAPSATSTGIAAYLTTISNTPALRQARIWKRFVRVRTDDLESVRTERTIKRVRSDVAAHSGSMSKEKNLIQEADHDVSMDSTAAPAAAQYTAKAVLDEPSEENQVSAGDSLPTPVQTPKELEDVTGGEDSDDAIRNDLQTDEVKQVTAPEDIPIPTTPVAADSPAPSARIHRSQSADPDKSSRLSRAFTQSTPNSQMSQELDGASSATGDDSSISTSIRRNGKKRSKSTRKDKEPKKSQRKVVIDDFEMMRVLGKGCAGKVLLVKHKTTSDMYALKAITKRHVLAHQELQHTLTEQTVLKRMAAEGRDPFVVKLWWSFHDKENLFLVMDFHPGGDLATQLARWGRLGRDRARFYAAEIVEGVEGLHAAGVIYRDLKPENILIGADGHIVLTDFGLSKEFPRRGNTASTPINSDMPATAAWMRNGSDYAVGWGGQAVGVGDQTTTFCGTAEYLAPEVIQGLPYSYEVDWWSFGTMLYEMLTGITPFWANNHSDMYVRVLQDELQFPEDRAIDQDTKSLIRGLLQRNPALRICEPRIKKHPYFSMIDWSHVYYKRYIPPYIPPIDPSNASDTQNFDDTFLDMEPVLDEYVDDQDQTTDTDQEMQTDTDRTDAEDTNTTPSQSRSSSIRPQQQRQLEDEADVFDGYSFKGRHSVLIDSDEDEDTGSDLTDELGDESSSVLGSITQSSDAVTVEVTMEEDGGEPKTPEARPVVTTQPVPADLEELDTNLEEPVPVTPTEESSNKMEEIVELEQEPIRPLVPAKDTVEVVDGTTAPVVPPKAPTTTTNRLPPPVKTNKRRERSGIPALDKDLEDEVGDDTEAADVDEDDDWDFIDAVDGEDRNGSKGTSLFARGVVDRYRLAVFRKASTPSSRNQNQNRSASGVSKASTSVVSENGNGSSSSPNSPQQQKRGRSGLSSTFRKGPRQFLQPKTPPSSYSSKKSKKSQSLQHSASVNMISGTSNSNSTTGFLTPSLSMGSSTMMSPSLRSKESAVSVGAQSFSSGQSNGNGNGNGHGGGYGNGNGNMETPVAEHGSHTLAHGHTPQQQHDTIKGNQNYSGLGDEKQKTKKLKKYKEGAEKVFSLFSSAASPRSHHNS